MSVRRATRNTVGVLVVAAAAAFAVVPATATTNPTPSSLQGECPTVMTLGEVSPGMRGTALSVTSGRNPVTFNAEVLGILRDALGPGRDLIVVNLSGNAVTAAGGLWEGASGSPVFFRDAISGKYEVAGAIAYGLAGGGSTLAGLTPAADMAQLLAPGPGVLAADPVEVELPLARRMAQATGLSVAQTGTLTRLRMPLSVSGLTDRSFARFRAGVERSGLRLTPYMGGSASSNPPVPVGKLRAGDNLAAALSLGDVTTAAVGTATWICKGQVVAFGHPLNWTGDAVFAARAADAITIVRDAVFGSYKLANIAESAGVVTQDRLAGIAGTVGVAPKTAPVTSTVTDLDSGRTRTGSSQAVTPGYLPFLTYMHLLTSTDVTVDRIGQGNSEIEYTIRGTRDGGVPWELRRTNHYASSDISFDSVLEVSNDVEVLGAFEGEEIDVTSVDVPRLEVEKALEQHRITKVLVWTGKRYVATNVVVVKRGKLIKLRVVLKSTHKPGTQNVDLQLRVPASVSRNGYVEILGGSSVIDEACFEGECEDEGGGEETELTFDQLLSQLKARPRGDQIVARLRIGPAGRVRATTTKQLDAVVRGGKALGVIVRR